MGSDAPETVERLRLPSPTNIKVHRFMCTELMKPVESVLKIFSEIEAARPRCESGIKSLVQLSVALDKARTLIRDCSESSKLYLAFTGTTILSRCKNAIKLLEQSLNQLQNMVPVLLASKISQIITEIKRVKISVHPSEEEAGKSVKGILEGYRMGNSSQNENVYECIRIIALKLQLTSSTALLIEQRSIKKLLIQLREEENKQQKKQILTILLNVLKNHGNLFTSVNVDNDSIVQNQEYRSRRVDSYVDREEPPKGITGIPPEEFKCPISCKVMYDPVVIDSGVTFERVWIQKWFDEDHDTCPKTQMKLSNFLLTPNTTMKGMISEWCETYGVTVSDPCVEFSTDWENSSSSITSLSSMYSLQLPIADYSNVSFSSLENTRELDVELSQELDGTLPWEFQCKFVEDLMIRLQYDDRACKFMQCEDLFESIIRFLKVARDTNDVTAQRIGCLLLSVLATKCRSIKTLSSDAYRLISELLGSEVKEEALAIMEGLSSHENHRSKIASSGAVTHIFNILDNTQTPQFQTPALKILNNLTSNRNFRSLRSSELIPKLVALSENDSLSSYCIAILKNLCGDQDNKSIIAETNGCIAFVANVLESESCEDQEQALEILVSLCSQSIDYCRLVMDEGVIPAIVCISINGNDKGKAKAHEMLRLLRDTGSEENVVEESPAPVYDVAVNDSNRIQVENTAPSRTSRFFSKFSKTPKRKV